MGASFSINLRNLFIICFMALCFTVIASCLTYVALSFGKGYFELSAGAASLQSVNWGLAILATFTQMFLFTFLPLILFYKFKRGYYIVLGTASVYCVLAGVNASWNLFVVLLVGL